MTRAERDSMRKVDNQLEVHTPALLFFLLSVEILDIIGNDMFTLFVQYQFKLIFKLVH